ncbi:hypothetical protein ABZT51_23045 [Streptomyces sp. NPDC005373]|uniref:tetratricopeptide repeat protein n=1 Tax=Streptomyces sp. NPDC005373 TaxID=3156879 RepID=UPI0033B2E010
MPRITLLRQLLKERHLTTYEAFAAQFARVARDVARSDGDSRLASIEVSSRQFDRWLGGELKTLPRPDTCRVLERLFARPAVELFAPATASTPVPEPPPATAITVGMHPVPVGGGPDAIAARTHQLVCGNVDEATLSFLSSSIDEVVKRYEQDGPYRLRDQTRQLHGLTHTLLGGQQPPRARQELFRLTARAAGLLGYMAVNTGEFRLAEAYCAEARDLSREIGDLDTELWACGTLSFSLYYAGRYAEADACAAAAVQRSPHHAQALRLLVNGRARALAKVGERAESERAIGQAIHLSDLHDVPDHLTPCISFASYGRARTLANALTARVSLHDTGQVLRDAEQLDDLIERSDSSWSRSLVRLDVATALLHRPAPDVEHAAALGREALALAGPSPISSVRQRSRDLYDLTASWRSRPAVRDYGEELRSWGSPPSTTRAV